MRVPKVVTRVFGLKPPQCPACGQAGAQRAHRTGLGERLISLVCVYPFRCGQCNQRFLAFSVGRWKKKQGVQGSEDL
jgi:hypothetical protein